MTDIQETRTDEEPQITPEENPKRGLSRRQFIPRAVGSLAVVRALWEQRDMLARRRDMTPGRVLPDSAIVAAATAAVAATELPGAELSELAEDTEMPTTAAPTAAADMALDQPAALRLGIGAGDGADGDAQPIGQIAMGGQALAGLQLPVAHIDSQRFGYCLVSRAAGSREVRNPYCHGDKLSIDSKLCQSLSYSTAYNRENWPENWTVT